MLKQFTKILLALALTVSSINLASAESSSTVSYGAPSMSAHLNANPNEVVLGYVAFQNLTAASYIARATLFPSGKVIITQVGPYGTPRANFFYKIVYPFDTYLSVTFYQGNNIVIPAKSYAPAPADAVPHYITYSPASTNKSAVIISN